METRNYGICSLAVVFGSLPEGPVADLDSGRALSSFIFIPVHHLNYFFDHIFLESHFYYILDSFIFLDISLKNRIKDSVGGEGILIFLIRPQFAEGGLLKVRLGMSSFSSFLF